MILSSWSEPEQAAHAGLLIVIWQDLLLSTVQAKFQNAQEGKSPGDQVSHMPGEGIYI